MIRSYVSVAPHVNGKDQVARTLQTDSCCDDTVARRRNAPDREYGKGNPDFTIEIDRKSLDFDLQGNEIVSRCDEI
jgi:hypothetical protein